MTAIEFPLSIVLVGAPGSGKLALAEAFEEKSADWFASHEQDITVIPNAGRTIEEKYDIALGMFGSCFEDLRAHFLRFEEEQTLLGNGTSFVTCGSIVENLAHCGANLETIITGLATPETQKRAQVQQIGMTMLTLSVPAVFRPTFAFYIPLPEPSGLVLPGAAQDSEVEKQYAQKIDNHIRMIFQNFGFGIQALDQPTLEEKVDVMYETVKEITENGVPEREVLGDTEIPEDVPPVIEGTLAEA